MSKGSKKNQQDEEKLKQALLSNLESRGLVEDMFTDKVDEYMDLWRRRKQLGTDIDQRGIAVLDEKRGMLVENRSVSLEVQISRQMLAIYTALGFKEQAANFTAPPPGGDDDEL